MKHAQCNKTHITNCLIHQEEMEVAIMYVHQLGHRTPRYPIRPSATVGIRNIIHQAMR